MNQISRLKLMIIKRWWQNKNPCKKNLAIELKIEKEKESFMIQKKQN